MRVQTSTFTPLTQASGSANRTATRCALALAAYRAQVNKKGSAYIAERRANETIASGVPTTPLMKFGDRVRMQAYGQGAVVFGANDHLVVSADIPSTRS